MSKEDTISWCRRWVWVVPKLDVVGSNPIARCNHFVPRTYWAGEVLLLDVGEGIVVARSSTSSRNRPITRSNWR